MSTSYRHTPTSPFIEQSSAEPDACHALLRKLSEVESSLPNCPPQDQQVIRNCLERVKKQLMHNASSPSRDMTIQLLLGELDETLVQIYHKNARTSERHAPQQRAPEASQAIRDVLAHQRHLDSTRPSPPFSQQRQQYIGVEPADPYEMQEQRRWTPGMRASQSDAGHVSRALHELNHKINFLKDSVDHFSESPIYYELRRDADALAHQLAHLQRKQQTQSVPPEQIEKLKKDVRVLLDTLSRLTARKEMKTLGGAFRDLTYKLEDLHKRGIPETQLKPIEHLLSDLRTLLVNAAQRPSPKAHEQTLHTISSRLDQLGHAGCEKTTYKELKGQIHEIRDLLGHASEQSDLIGQISERVSHLSQQMNRLSSGNEKKLTKEMGYNMHDIRGMLNEVAQDSILTHVDQRIDSLSAHLERIVRTCTFGEKDRTDIQELQAHVSYLSARIDRLIDDSPHETLRSDIAQHIARYMKENAAETSQEYMRATRHIEELMQGVSAKVDLIDQRVHVPANVADTLAHMIQDLAQRVEAVQSCASESGAAQKLAALIGQWEQAQHALMHMAQETYKNFMQSQETLKGFDISRELAYLQQSQEDMTNQTHASLNVVHETLGKVLSRLDQMHGIPPQDGTPTQTWSPYGSKSLDEDYADLINKLRFHREDALAYPYGAGIKRPPTTFPEDDPVPSHAGHEAITLHNHQVKTGFIAAARRALQKTPAQPAGPLPTPQQINRQEGRALAKRARILKQARGRWLQLLAQKPIAADITQLKKFLSLTRKPLLVGLAASIVILFSAHITRIMIPAQIELSNDLSTAATPPMPEVLVGNTIGVKEGQPAEPYQMALSPQPVANAPAMNGQANPPSKELGFDPTPVSSVNNAIIPAATPAKTSVAPPVMDQLTDLISAANRNNPQAQYALAMRYEQGQSVPRDMTKAAHWFEKAAQLNLAPAQYRIGSLYEKGLGVQRDLGTALKWYGLAAKAGNSRAMHNFAVLSAEIGANGKPNYPQSAEWFRKAAENGLRDSQYNLAILYYQGLGVEKNLSQSYVWFSLAASQGDDEAGRKRDLVAMQLDAKQIAAAKAMVAGFQARPEVKEANDVANIVSPMGAILATQPLKTQ